MDLLRDHVVSQGTQGISVWGLVSNLQPLLPNLPSLKKAYKIYIYNIL